jgi:hypothetical protein
MGGDIFPPKAFSCGQWLKLWRDNWRHLARWKKQMGIMDWIRINEPVISLASSIVLVAVTGIYVYLTHEILKTTIRQSNLASNPVISIRLGEMTISEVWGDERRSLVIGPNLANIGNAPAIGVLVDGELILQYSNIEGETIIPARFEPIDIPFIRCGEDLPDEQGHNSLSFGNTCITHLLDDFREEHRLNMHRIATDPSRVHYNASLLRICIYYQNNLGQYFESAYETYLIIGKRLGLDDNIPNDNETTTLSQIYIPRPKFSAGPIQNDEVNKRIAERNSKRDLCGV